VPALEAAVSRNPQVAKFQFHLGMAYAKAEQPTQAHTCLQTTLQLGPSGDDKRSAEEALQKTGT
jgi:cytochrome c-type biogenesis protein CcmH/NrfG